MFSSALIAEIKTAKSSILAIQLIQVCVLFSFLFGLNPFLTYVSLLETERPCRIVTPHADGENRPSPHL
jgi:hypothetical protein